MKCKDMKLAELTMEVNWNRNVFPIFQTISIKLQVYLIMCQDIFLSSINISSTFVGKFDSKRMFLHNSFYFMALFLAL